MTGVSDKNFGVLIAYLLPGLVGLAAIGKFSPLARSWLGTSTLTPTVGGFLYGTLASVAVGLAVSAIRWLVLDKLHHWTGLVAPAWDFSALHEKLPAFEGAVQNHYRYYQFYGNMFVALIAATIVHWPLDGLLSDSLAINGVVVIGGLALFFAASRDTLRKYYARTGALLRPTASLQEVDHDQRLASPEKTTQVERHGSPEKIGGEAEAPAQTRPELD